MQLPIRIRLSIWYFVIFSFAGLLLSAASYYLARRSLYLELDHELGEHIDDVRDFFRAEGLGGDYQRERAEIAAQFQLQDEGKWLQIQDDQGRWVFRPWRMQIAPHDVPLAKSLSADGNYAEFPAGTKRIRSLRRSFTVNGHTFVVESGMTLTKADQTLLHFRNGLLLISPVIFLIAGFAGHLLSRRALDPVAAIAREAQRIHDGNLQTRLPQLETRDELAHLSSTLNEMLERIEAGVRSVRDFTAYASHELRTPVTFIRMETDLALRFDRSNAEYREAIAMIDAEALRMSSLLDSLLFLARTDAGAESAQLEPVNARKLCLQACKKWNYQFKGRKLLVSVPAEPAMVIADKMYLPRLLSIILENAGKYTPAGGLVELKLEIMQEFARFEVHDSGIGILDMDRGRIFDRFFRGSNVQEANAHGSGLGLALAAWIAARHNTFIEVSSTPGKGSCFSWVLSLTREYEQNPSDMELEAHRSHQQGPAALFPIG